VGTVGLQAQGKPPAIDFNCLGDNLDLTRLREAVRFVMRLLDAPEMRALGGPLLSPADADLGSDATIDRWLAATVRTAQHPAGTCAMGAASDPLAVLDGECRVRGIGGLRVIDASSMPDVVSVNSNASTIMLAERAVEFMR